MNTHALLQQIEKAAREAGRIMTTAGSDLGIDAKPGHANFVTAYDTKVQDYLVKTLSALLPEARFLAEEEGADAFHEEYRKGYLFVIDPIDGTTNFIKGLQMSVTSIGLFKDGKPFLSVVYHPYRDEMYTAIVNEGSYCNGKRLQSSPLPLSESVITIGTSPYRKDLRDDTMWMIRSYLDASLDLRRTGSAVYDLCLVASGVFGAFVECTLGLWDYAAGSLILSEAGGKLLNLYGTELTYDGPSSMLAMSAGVAETEPHLYLKHE